MKIENFRTETTENLARVSATVHWEDCDLPTQQLYFETPKAFAQSLSCNPDAFLVACAMPAMRRGEARISVDAEICPKLQENLITAMSCVHHWCEWYGSDQQLLRIEAKTSSHLPIPNPPQRAGWFCSGGIDSLAILRTNRLHFPLEHPESIKDGLLIYGFDFGRQKNLNEREAFEQLMTSLLTMTQEAGVTLIPVYTNIRQELEIDHKFIFWVYEFSGAALAAVAHAFSQQLSVASISSTFDIPHLQQPWAQHPLVDPYYSSYGMKIQHSGIALSRLAKTKLVADWDVALQHLRVCNNVQRMQPGMLNCGNCEKCIRTMITLLALGKLDQTGVFPKVDLSEELLMRKVYVETPYKAACYRDLIVPLAAQGRHDLVRGIQRIIARGEAEWWKRVPKQLDRRFFNGNLLKLYKEVPTANLYRKQATPLLNADSS